MPPSLSRHAGRHLSIDTQLDIPRTMTSCSQLVGSPRPEDRFMYGDVLPAWHAVVYPSPPLRPSVAVGCFHPLGGPHASQAAARRPLPCPRVARPCYWSARPQTRPSLEANVSSMYPYRTGTRPKSDALDALCPAWPASRWTSPLGIASLFACPRVIHWPTPVLPAHEPGSTHLTTQDITLPPYGYRYYCPRASVYTMYISTRLSVHTRTSV